MSTLATLPISSFLTQLAAKSPTPGGGAVAGLTGATAAALARMVVSYSLGKKNLAPHQPYLEESAAALDRAAALFVELADEDAACYAILNELQRLPDTDPRRAAELPAAIDSAVRVPLACAAAASDLLRHCERLVTCTNPHLRSDLAIAAVLAEAAVASACWNVRVNTPQMPAESERSRLAAEVDRLLREGAARREVVERGCV